MGDNVSHESARLLKRKSFQAELDKFLDVSGESETGMDLADTGAQVTKVSHIREDANNEGQTVANMQVQSFEAAVVKLDGISSLRQ